MKRHMDIINKIIFITFAGIIVVSFQNCGDYRFKSNTLSQPSTEESCEKTNECNSTENNQSSNDNQESETNNNIDPLAPNMKSYDFYDSFESADMNKTNNFGFYWEKNNRTSVIRDDQYAVWNNGAVLNGPVSNKQWEVNTGQHALRFRYPSGDYMSEQRFQLGKHYADLWISYWIRVPINYSHGSLNNKFLSLWPETYDRKGTVTWQTRPNGDGGANLVVQDGGVTSGETLSTPFISVPNDRGRWMQIVVRVKSATGPTNNDGIIRLYRRWKGEDSFQKLHDKSSADTWDTTSSTQGISRGYILGWANDAYSVDTEWLVDDFAVTSDPIIAD